MEEARPLSFGEQFHDEARIEPVSVPAPISVPLFACQGRPHAAQEPDASCHLGKPRRTTNSRQLKMLAVPGRHLQLLNAMCEQTVVGIVAAHVEPDSSGMGRMRLVTHS